jgi:SAM-dependent methyltransferase
VNAPAYGTLAAVYEWLVPDDMVTPAGSAAAYDDALAELPAGARVLDCATGTGELAVGLALRGFDVAATDASPAMVERTRRQAAEHGATVHAAVCRWDELAPERFPAPFDAVFCVGNSLAHAPGAVARGAALAGMARVLRPGGLLVLTARNFERERAAGSRLDVWDRLVERRGRRGVVIYAWEIAPKWEARHAFEIAVAFVADDGTVTTHRERLFFWPFRHATLHDDLRAAGLGPERSTYAEDSDRYLVTARRSA